MQWYRSVISPYGRAAELLHALVRATEEHAFRCYGKVPEDLCFLSCPTERGDYELLLSKAAALAVQLVDPTCYVEEVGRVDCPKPWTVQIGEQSWLDILAVEEGGRR